MSSSLFLRFLPFFFIVFLFFSSAALAATNNVPLAAEAPLSKLKQTIQSGAAKALSSSNEEPTAEPSTTIAALESSSTTAGADPVTAYVRLVLTVNQRKAERFSTPNAQGNLRKKLREIIATAIGRPADGLNITMTIDDIEGQNPNKKNPKVLLIVLIAVPAADASVGQRADTGNNASSAFAAQLMEETGAEAISVQTTYGFPPSTSDGLPFTSSDDSLFEAYKTLILAVSVSIIGVVLLGAVILFLTKTKERRERLLELFRFGGRGRREANQSISTFDHRRINGSRRETKRNSSRYSGRANSGRKNNSGRQATASTVIAPQQGSVSVPAVSVPAQTNQV